MANKNKKKYASIKSNKSSKANKNKTSQYQKPVFLYKDYTERVDVSGQNRWSMTFGLLNGNFTKLLLLNILLLLFFLPTIAFIVWRQYDLTTLATSLPFMHNNWIGGYYPSSVGDLQILEMFVNRLLYLGLLVFGIIGPIAFSGGFYLIRNFVWSNGNLNTKDFFKGIKNSYLKILFYTLVLVCVFILSIYSISLSNYYYVINGGWYFWVAKICAIIIMCLSTLLFLYCCSLTVTYKLPLFTTVKYAFKLSFNFIIPNLFFLALCVLPFIVIYFTGFSGMINMIIGFIVIFAGFIYLFLIWSSYSQYVFDKIFEGKIDTSVKVKQSKKSSSAVVKEEKDTEFVKPVTDDVEIEQLPEMFSRKDIEKLNESKERMKADSDKYYNERKNKKKDGDSNE